MRNNRSEYVAHESLRDGATHRYSWSPSMNVRHQSTPPRMLLVTLFVIDACAIIGLMLQVAKF